MHPDEYHSMARVEQTHPWFVNRRRLIRGVLQRFGPRKGRPRVLDAGCGTGVNLADYAAFARPTGVEFDPFAASLSARRSSGPVAVGDLCRLPFRDASFDVVISTDVIEHIADDVAALREMCRVLEPAGRIVITTPAYSWAYSGHDRFLHHVRRYDHDRLHRAFRRAGLKVLHSARYNVLLTVPVLASRLLRRASNGSDVGRALPGAVAAGLDWLWSLEASLAERIDLRFGLTHLAVLAHA